MGELNKLINFYNDFDSCLFPNWIFTLKDLYLHEITNDKTEVNIYINN